MNALDTTAGKSNAFAHAIATATMDLSPAVLRSLLDVCDELTRAFPSAYGTPWSAEGERRMSALYEAMKASGDWEQILRSSSVPAPDFRAYVWREVLLRKPSLVRGLDLAVFLRDMNFLATRGDVRPTFHGLVTFLLLVDAGEMSLTRRLEVFVEDTMRDTLVHYTSGSVLEEQIKRYTQKVAPYAGRSAEATFLEVIGWLHSRVFITDELVAAMLAAFPDPACAFWTQWTPAATHLTRRLERYRSTSPAAAAVYDRLGGAPVPHRPVMRRITYSDEE